MKIKKVETINKLFIKFAFSPINNEESKNRIIKKNNIFYDFSIQSILKSA